MTYKEIDKQALQISQRFKKCEADLLNIIIAVDDKKVFRKMGYASLFQYVVNRMQLSESLAYNFINVARKAKEVPELKKTIERGELSVCKAKKITSVINNSNHEHWLSLARSVGQRKVEREVALAQPHKSIPERLTYVSPTVEITEKVQIKSNSPKVKLELRVSEKLMLKLRRAQDLISQKHRESVSLETVLDVLADHFLERNDPMEKAKRQMLKRKLRQDLELESRPVKSTPTATAAAAATTASASAATTPTAATTSNASTTTATTSKPGKVQVARPVNLQTIREKSEQTPQEDKSKRRTMGQSTRKPLPASIKHRVYLRDQGRCSARDESGQKCQSQRFLEVHHLLPLAQGGKDELENLTLLCSGHHKAFHECGHKAHHDCGDI